MSFHNEALVGVTCTTVGTGATLTCGPALPPPFCAFSVAYADGDTFTYCLRDTSGAFEEGLGQFNASGNTITRVTVYSAGTATVRTYGSPYNFGSGTRNLFVDFPSSRGGLMIGPNNLSEITSQATARTNLGLGSASILPGGTSGANTLLELDAAGKLPAIDCSQATALPAIKPAPSGTKEMVFQAAAPAGWSVSTAVNDSMIGVTDNNTGLGHPAGGTTSGIGWDATWGITSASHILVASEIPMKAAGSGTGIAAYAVASMTSTLDGNSTVAHSHALSSALTWRPPTLNGIVIVKS